MLTAPCNLLTNVVKARLCEMLSTSLPEPTLLQEEVYTNSEDCLRGKPQQMPSRWCLIHR
jgi:hypothetical protein